MRPERLTAHSWTLVAVDARGLNRPLMRFWFQVDQGNLHGFVTSIPPSAVRPLPYVAVDGGQLVLELPFDGGEGPHSTALAHTGGRNVQLRFVVHGHGFIGSWVVLNSIEIPGIQLVASDQM